MKFTAKKHEMARVELEELNPEALLADGFEEALVGVCHRFGQNPIAAYDWDACIEILKDRDGMTHEEAVEFFEYNVIEAWVGDNTPCFVSLSKDIN